MDIHIKKKEAIFSPDTSSNPKRIKVWNSRPKTRKLPEKGIGKSLRTLILAVNFFIYMENPGNTENKSKNEQMRFH